MQALTDFGDSAVLLPLSVMVLVWLIIARPARAAIGWAVALGFLLTTMTVLKVAFVACPPTAGLESPSGHTAFSILVYGGLAVVLLGGRRPEYLRVAGTILAGILIAGIAISRAFLGAHSWIEIAVGFVVGTIALGIFVNIRGQGHPPVQGVRLAALIAGTILILVLLHGAQLHIEVLLRLLGLELGLHVACR
jgi:membrane-associated phospholipid phosphatase